MKNKLFCAAVLLAAAPLAQASCGAAFCMINTNWTLQGPVSEPGLRADLRYEYMDQNQPMKGSHKVSVGEEPSADHEEVDTTNRNWLANFDYTFDQNWAVNASVPVVDRHHVHLENEEDGAQERETWDFRRLGDIRVVGRRQWVMEAKDHGSVGFAGLTFGIKLPTGRFDLKNGQGEEAERSLQPGSGTTDLILGAFYTRVLPDQELSFFAQVQAQRATAERDGYRPGSKLTADIGGRYEATDKMGLLLQLNAALTGRDQGSEAEPEDSGGRFLFISPGVSYAVAKGVQLYGIAQFPLYQKVNGVQLTAEQAFVGGVSVRF